MRPVPGGLPARLRAHADAIGDGGTRRVPLADDLHAAADALERAEADLKFERGEHELYKMRYEMAVKMRGEEPTFTRTVIPAETGPCYDAHGVERPPNGECVQTTGSYVPASPERERLADALELDAALHRSSRDSQVRDLGMADDLLAAAAALRATPSAPSDEEVAVELDKMEAENELILEDYQEYRAAKYATRDAIKRIRAVNAAALRATPSAPSDEEVAVELAQSEFDLVYYGPDSCEPEDPWFQCVVRAVRAATVRAKEGR